MNQRTEIPRALAAEVLFQSDRTCCVCRERGRAVQIHHIDEDPSNHSPENLAVLCLNCHRDTQIRGGFDRKLDANQIVLYRDDWHEHIRRRRVGTSAPIQPTPTPSADRDREASRRSTALLNFVNTLPAQRQVVYARAQEDWDTGGTATMMNASYSLIHNLQSYLVGLASFYPRGHFGPAGAEEYFHEFTKSRFDWHWKQLEPDGPGTRGTMIGPIASGYVISDLENMIVDMVRSLTQDEDDFNYTAWLECWTHAA